MKKTLEIKNFLFLFTFLISAQFFYTTLNGEVSFKPRRGYSPPVPKEVTLKGILLIKADVGNLPEQASLSLTFGENGLAITKSVYESKISDAEIRAFNGKLVELKGMGISSNSASKTKMKNSYCTITRIDSIKEILPKSEAMIVEGKLSKTDNEYILTTTSTEKIKISLNDKAGITAEKLDKLIDRKVEVKGLGYIKGKHFFTELNSIAETILIMEGVLLKKEDVFFVKSITNEEIKIVLDDKSSLNQKNLDKLIGKKVIVKGTGSLEMSHYNFTTINSITETIPKKVN